MGWDENEGSNRFALLVDDQLVATITTTPGRRLYPLPLPAREAADVPAGASDARRNDS